MSCGDIFLGFIAVFFPPVAVWIKSGICSADSLINILLCMLGYLPGLIHAWYIIAKNPEYDYEGIPDSEESAANGPGQRVTYYYVSHEARPQRNAGYGTQNQRPKPAAPQNTRPANATVAGPSTSAGGEEAAAPPSYADAVKGDHKIQSRD